MSARTGMAQLIDMLRSLTNAGTADYTLGTATFWDDDHLQAVLDRHRADIAHDMLSPVITHVASGSVDYKIYQSRYGNLESGTAVFAVEDSTGADIGTASWSADYIRGIITFGTTTGGSTYYLTARAYDLNAAAADVWRQKAGYFADKYSFSTDGGKFDRSDAMKHAREMAVYFDGLSQPITVKVSRGDE